MELTKEEQELLFLRIENNGLKKELEEFINRKHLFEKVQAFFGSSFNLCAAYGQDFIQVRDCEIGVESRMRYTFLVKLFTGELLPGLDSIITYSYEIYDGT